MQAAIGLEARAAIGLEVRAGCYAEVQEEHLAEALVPDRLQVHPALPGG